MVDLSRLIAAPSSQPPIVFYLFKLPKVRQQNKTSTAIIMSDPELKAQYEATTIRELQRVGARIDRQNERAIQAILEGRLDSQ
jgi:hypothetical protein